MTLLQLEPATERIAPAGPAPALGALLIADLAPGIPALAEALVSLRAAPWCPLVLLVPDRRVAGQVLAAFEPVPGIFATLYAADRPALPLAQRSVAAVRRRPVPQLTVLAAWLEHRLGKPGVASTLTACFHCEAGVQPGRTLTRRLQELGRFEVRDWRGLARLAQLVAAGGHWPPASLESTALEAGIDPRTLRRWLRLATALSWPEATRRPGWEWILESALQLGGYVSREKAMSPAAHPGIAAAG